MDWHDFIVFGISFIGLAISIISFGKNESKGTKKEAVNAASQFAVLSTKLEAILDQIARLQDKIDGFQNGLSTLREEFVIMKERMKSFESELNKLNGRDSNA